MNLKSGFLLILLTVFLSFPAAAVEFTEGAIRLVLDEETGRFSLYSIRHQNNQQKPMALFADQDNRTSFLSVMVNDRIFKLGDSSAFRTSLGGNMSNPSLVFESSSMLVTQEFSFVRTIDSVEANGIYVKITLENRGDRQISAGARFLLDTNLGERISGFPFTTNKRSINSETLLTISDGDNFWTDRNDTVSLTGSLFTGSSVNQSGGPDSVHFANWKKLSDVSWKAAYQPGKNFNFPPYSLGDAAVCYYFEPGPLNRGERRSFGFYLVLNSERGFGSPAAGVELIKNLPEQASIGKPPAVSSPDPAAPLDSGNVREQDLATLRELTARIDTLILSGTATEEELAALELALNNLRAKYGNSLNLR